MKTKAYSMMLVYSWLFLFGLVPLGCIFALSFLSDDPEHMAALPLTFHNYSALVSPLFSKVLLRSLVMAGSTTTLCLFLAYPLSYIIMKSRWKTTWLFLIIIPFWTNSLIRIYSLIAVLKVHGVLNTMLLKLHMIAEPLALLYTNFSVLCGMVYNLLPFMVLPIFANMERFDFRLIEAAQDLGASKLTTFFRVFLPHTYSGILAGSLLVFLPAMTLFYIPDILGGARSVLLGNLIQHQFLGAQNWPQGAATSMIITLMLTGILSFYRPKLKEVA